MPESPQSETITISQTATPSQSITAPFPTMGRPSPGSGELTVELRKTESGPVTAEITLFQGSTVIASTAVSPTTSFADYSLGLTADDVNRLTTGACNLSDLMVRVGFPIQTDCCENRIRSVLKGVFDTSGIWSGGPCDALHGETVELGYNEDTSRWEYSGILSCGDVCNIQVFCDSPGFDCTNLKMTGDIQGAGFESVVNESCECDPFSVTFSFNMMAVPPETFSCCSRDDVFGLQIEFLE